jgi:L-asparaginase
MFIKLFAVGGTIDKDYFDQKNDYQVGDPKIVEILKEANVTLEYDCESLLKKDSLQITDEDRKLLHARVASDPNEKIVITHGTDTMPVTGRLLKDIPGKTIVITGSMQPAKFRSSDAVFNIGCAIMAAQILPHGIYLVMNGEIFDPTHTVKNVEKSRFERTE